MNSESLSQTHQEVGAVIDHAVDTADQVDGVHAVVEVMGSNLPVSGKLEALDVLGDVVVDIAEDPVRIAKRQLVIAAARIAFDEELPRHYTPDTVRYMRATRAHRAHRV